MKLLSILLCVFVSRFAYGDVLIQQNDHSFFSIRIQGVITDSDFAALTDKISMKTAKQSLAILLDSPGGNVRTALKMGEIIRRSNAPVIVPENAGCLSSCVFLLAAGAKRLVIGDVGIHRPFSIQDDIATEKEQKQQYAKTETAVKKYLKKVNISTMLYDEMVIIPPSEMRLLTEGDLKRFGLSDDDPYLKEAEVTRQSAAAGITKKEFYRREARLNQCLGLEEEETNKCYQHVIESSPRK